MKCIYGCGQDALFEGMSFYGKGKFRCAESWTHCPVKREQISKRVKTAQARKSPSEKLAISAKRKNTLSKIHEDGLTGMQKNMLAVAQSRRNPDGTYRGIEKTVRTKRMTKNENGEDIFTQSAVKTAITRFGLYVGLEGKTDFEKYKYAATQITNQQPLHILRNIEKRAGYGKSDDPYQLDHIFSVAHGFVNKIPPQIIGHISNLRMLPSTENNSKGSRCDVTVKELLENYFTYQNSE